MLVCPRYTARIKAVLLYPLRKSILAPFASNALRTKIRKNGVVKTEEAPKRFSNLQIKNKYVPIFIHNSRWILTKEKNLGSIGFIKYIRIVLDITRG